ncbi:MAG: hypothetical protein A2622_09185 [Bdellovibrionales bacterium RIFCSPHIGHO2_01_FULL_40_29]|nr:MAG: hypothetical protein A2622_09185 [Bdellovibrionales bacterium RIFCSPHIGHO2_01_FULL_40_29]OFZ32904.1 MAG: hypothetical protein A3D17_09395 [Bdellovibrionales bacterium RIFCSPHIGHO2_02_FULL_40_15]
MGFRMRLTDAYFALFLIFATSCFSTPVRLPQSASQVYNNSQLQQDLLLAAQNNILFHIDDSVVREVEKSVVDNKCRKIEEPFWAEKLSEYLSEFRKRPELLTRIHILEIKRGDNSQIQVQKDLDGAVTLSIEFVKIESRGKIGYQTNLPCSGPIAEYMGRDIVKTDFDFPSTESLAVALSKLPERSDVPRFQFSNLFLSYLAERGVIFKFNHEFSFEKTNNGKYVMAEVLNHFAEETKEPFHKYINYWFKEISQKSTQAQLIQMFAVLPDKEARSGVRVESEGEQARRVLGQSDLTYVYTSYWTDDSKVNVVSLKELDQCLQTFANDMSGVKLRKPATTEKESFLRPGYSCTKSN